MMHQASNREIEGGRMNAAVLSQHSHSLENNNGQSQSQQQYQESQNDDFLEQMLSTIPNCSWPPTPNDLPSPTSNPNTKIVTNNTNFKSGDSHADDDPAAAFQFPFDDLSLVSKSLQLQQQQQQQQQQFLLSGRSPADAMLPLPLSLGNPDSVDASAFKSQTTAEASLQALYNGLAGSIQANAQPVNQQHFHPPPPPPQGGSVGGGQKASASTGGSNGAGAPQRQRVRARRGQATDPHSIAERLRRERIAQRMKALQELVPNANKTDKASMLDEIIDYVKFLQLQVKVLSMSRLGGASAVAPLVTDMNSEGVGQSNGGNQTAPPTNDGMTVTEHQVAKLMEEDMGSAMQYLQGKGLCLMPISLASVISTTSTSLTRTPGRPHIDNNGNHHHDINDNHHHHHHHHPLYAAMPSSNGEGDHILDSSHKDPSGS